MQSLPKENPIYIYLDEGGDLAFSRKGSRYFTLTAFITRRPPQWADPLLRYRSELREIGVHIPYFHASEDKQIVRDFVFQLLASNRNRFLVDSLIVEKAKTGPALQEHVQFYSRMIGYLLRYRLEKLDLTRIDKVIVITDGLPADRKRKRAIEKAIKEQLSRTYFWKKTPYAVIHDSSKNHLGLQLADYCNWAIFRKWERNDLRSYELIKDRIVSEFEIFRNGERIYY